MPKINIILPADLDVSVEIYKAYNKINNKREAIVCMLREFINSQEFVNPFEKKK